MRVPGTCQDGILGRDSSNEAGEEAEISPQQLEALRALGYAEEFDVS